jgi:hypothetical protein
MAILDRKKPGQVQDAREPVVPMVSNDGNAGHNASECVSAADTLLFGAFKMLLFLHGWNSEEPGNNMEQSRERFRSFNGITEWCCQVMHVVHVQSSYISVIGMITDQDSHFKTSW